MKSKFTSLFALALLLGFGIRPAQAQLGFGVGLNFDSPQDIQLANNQEANLENASGYHIGIFFDTGIGPLAIRPGIFYRQTNNLRFSEGNVSAPSLPDEFDLSLIEVPIDIRFSVLPLPLVSPYVLAGPVFSLPSSNDEEIDDGLESVAVSAAVGLGVEVSVPIIGVRIMPELRYAFGISRYIKEDASIGNVDVEGSNIPNSFQIRLNVAL